MIKCIQLCKVILNITYIYDPAGHLDMLRACSNSSNLRQDTLVYALELRSLSCLVSSHYKWPIGLVYIANLINYLWKLLDPFPWGLYIDLEGSSTFLPLMLSMHIDKLGLSSYLYGTLFICITAYPSSCVGTTALWMECRWNCIVAVSAQCSAHQLPGCECSAKRSCTPLGCQNGACMGICGHIQPYIHEFTCIYKLKTCICIVFHPYVYLFILKYFYIYRYMLIQVHFGLHLVSFYNNTNSTIQYIEIKQ